ncbi:hypothetical protein [Usitatibacter palustris]|uniref:Uncharacterized protein n=1 Tax=Usitatibacter palustris TaxID=2732487 RepID=A0A6M4H6I0_9PROT|nr:hypothetical protein [Usitatibacter palustris]QJR13557.1 hypothetical protein DSM104440_00341 [Usitatibacter palustris]
MKQFLVCSLLLAVVPMVLLNPMGRDAFLGYYLGVVATWFVVICVGKWQNTAQARLR